MSDKKKYHKDDVVKFDIGQGPMFGTVIKYKDFVDAQGDWFGHEVTIRNGLAYYYCKKDDIKERYIPEENEFDVAAPSDVVRFDKGHGSMFGTVIDHFSTIRNGLACYNCARADIKERYIPEESPKVLP